MWSKYQAKRSLSHAGVPVSALLPFRQLGLWLCLFPLALPWPVGAAEPNEPPAPTGWLDALKTDAPPFPCRLGEDAKATFWNTPNLIALAGAGAASAVLHTTRADDDIADYFADHKTFDTFSQQSLYIIGSPYTQFGATALWYVLEAEYGSDPGRRRAVTMFSALTINAGVTGALKLAAHNHSPNGKDWAWPSGHTSSSVTVASVLHEFYGWKVGLPAYAVSGVVAWRMMAEGDHWASDVVFGAVLGWVVGHTVAGRDGPAAIAGWELVPYYGNYQCPAAGLSLAKRF